MAIQDNRAGIAAHIFEADMREWLRGGEVREDGRLALFDQFGEPIQTSPMRPQWTVCRLTPKGQDFLARPAKTR